MGNYVYLPHLPMVFTDLDGTLLDHATYDFSPALPALNALRERNIPLIPTTSKTAEEVKDLMAEIGLTGGAITENGAAILRGSGACEAVGQGYDALRGFLDALPNELRAKVTGFGDMSVKDIMHHTGLGEERAEKAKARTDSEPFLWAGTERELEELIGRIKAAGLTLTQGGRFYHLLPEADKSIAMGQLVAEYLARNGAETATTLALGDGPNDFDMLKAADRGVIIPNPHGVDLTSRPGAETLHIAVANGPTGWNQSVLEWLESLEQQ